MLSRFYEVFITNKTNFQEGIEELLSKVVACEGTITRLVFFGEATDNTKYLDELSIIKKDVENAFSSIIPMVSYVGQASLVGTLSLEVWGFNDSFDGTIEPKNCEGIDYLVAENQSFKELVIGGLQYIENLNADVRDQSSYIFDKLEKILAYEKLETQDIVRQWNYIEHITGFNGESQRYQEFNDARSYYYNSSTWAYGYPAATGIGATRGGIMIDVDAIKSKVDKQISVCLDNSLQVAAHKYSEEVLLGVEDEFFEEKTTPKFERAKAIVHKNAGYVYISGTAAIRGEDSLTGVPVVEQAKITMENIYHLISIDNLALEGVHLSSPCKIEVLRVYVKYPSEINEVELYMKNNVNVDKIIYLQADVCREELLIEIEGIASFTA